MQLKVICNTISLILHVFCFSFVFYAFFVIEVIVMKQKSWSICEIYESFSLFA